MKHLKACLESQVDSNQLPEVPTPEKDDKLVVMQGPLSTIMSLALMKRYADEQPAQVVDNEEPQTKQTTDTQVIQENGEVASTPQSLAMEMQMAYLDNVLDKVELNTQTSQQEIADGKERFRNYFTLTTKANFVYLDD